MKRFAIALVLCLIAGVAIAQSISPAPGSGGSSGVSSINSNTGAFTFTGAGVGCSGTTCTFASGAGSTINLGTSSTAPNPKASASDTTTGLYTIGTGSVSFSSAGTDVIDVNATNGINIPLVTTIPIMSVAGSPFLQNFNNGNSLALGVGAGANLPSNAFDDLFIGYLSGNVSTAINQENTGVGFSTLQYSVTAGSGNTSLGAGAMWHATTDTGGVGVGADDQRDGCQGTANTSVGRQTLRSFFGASDNAAVGYGAMFGNAASLSLSGTPTTGDTIPITFTDANLSGGHVTITYTVLSSDTTNAILATSLTTFITTSNVGDGIAAGGIGIANNGVVSIEHTGNSTIACGGSVTLAVTVGTIGGAGSEVVTVGNGTTGGNNTFAGYEAGYGAASTTAANNSGFGFSSLAALTTGTQNDASGFESLLQNTTGTGNTAHGYFALSANTTGSSNVVLGAGAMTTGTTASNNVAIGNLALSFATGNGNIGVGVNVGRNTSTGTGEVFIGANVAGTNTNTLTGVFNTVIGTNNSASGLTGAASQNTLVGSSAGLTSASGDTLIGFQTGNALTTGASNTMLGNAVGKTTCVTSTNNILIGVNSNIDCSSSSQTSSIHIGIGGDWVTVVNAGAPSTESTTMNGTLTLPNVASSSAAQTGTLCWATGGLITYDGTVGCLTSSRRFKKDIQPLSEDSGVAEVMALNPVSYTYKDPKIGGDKTHVGLIAEDVDQVDKRLVGYDTEGMPHGVAYENLTSVLVKAIQQQQAEIDELRASKGLPPRVCNMFCKAVEYLEGR